MKKHEFSKLILGSVMLLYFAGAVFGGAVIIIDHAGLEALLAYIGAPTATAIGFYAWKARAENVIKISQTLEKDRKITEQTKQKLISGIAKTISDIETEEFDNGS